MSQVRTLGKHLTLVDLFAGCGGLSLGFETAGFSPVIVSELNDSARSTYLANRVEADLFGRKVVFPKADVRIAGETLSTDLLAVGDIAELSEPILKKVRRAASTTERKGVDVVAGGPPCQGFSGIGIRRTHKVDKHEIPSNHLYKEMIRVVDALTPKAFVFENVKGLLYSRWTARGTKGEAWEDIRGSFKEALGDRYVIGWQLVEARWFGIPQNRPRVLMVGIRRDIFGPANESTESAFDLGLLPARPEKLQAPGLRDVLGDLCDPSWRPGIGSFSTVSYPARAGTAYQIAMRLDPKTGVTRGKGSPLTEHDYSNHGPQVLERFQAILSNDTATLKRLQTKKFAQRALPAEWGPAGPSITVTSLPDDFVHFEQPRSLTVREWARIQGFPDWYEFRGPRTTGGERRAGNPSMGIWSREVPKYTQIGNAVPVRLAAVVADHLAKLIR